MQTNKVLLVQKTLTLAMFTAKLVNLTFHICANFQLSALA